MKYVEKIKNGSTVLFRAPWKNDLETDVVLCAWPEHYREGEKAPFVSWVVDEEGHAFWGKYHGEAIPAFCERTGYDEDVVRAYVEGVYNHVRV